MWSYLYVMFCEWIWCVFYEIFVVVAIVEFVNKIRIQVFGNCINEINVLIQVYLTKLLKKYTQTLGKYHKKQINCNCDFNSLLNVAKTQII